MKPVYVRPLFIPLFILIVFLGIFLGLVRAVSADVAIPPPETPHALTVSIVGNTLQINPCSQLLGFMGYKGYVDNLEVFTTGTYGGFPCFNGNLFIQDLVHFPGIEEGKPSHLIFNFYADIGFYQPPVSGFNVYYDGSTFTVFDASTHIQSFDISTSTRIATVHDYITLSDIGSGINFSVGTSTQNHLYVSDTVYATSTGDFYYSWNYPELTPGNNYIFQTDIASSTTLISTSTTISLVTPTTPSCSVDCFSNVLFIPGLEASRLYEQKTILGIPVEDQLWEPNFFGDVNGLYLNPDGTSMNDLYTRDIIDSTLVFKVYKDLIGQLNNLVLTNKISEWKAYAYDWRQGVKDIVDNGTPYLGGKVSLVTTLQSLVDSSKNGKVTIVTHSNGGLVVKALVRKLQDMKDLGQSTLVDHVDTLVMVAAPQLGTPDGFSAILHGYKQSIPYKLMSEVQARKLAQNMPSAYGLLPSKKYFEQVNTAPIGIFTPTAPTIYKTSYGADINTYQEEHNFILGTEGRAQATESDLISPIKGNGLLLTQAESLHDSIDTMTFPSTMKIIDIAGWGKATIAGVTYTDSDIQPVYTIRGDKTVVMQSSLYGPGAYYWLDLSNSTLSHKDIMEDPQLLAFIDHTITGQPLVFSIITDTEPFQIGDRLHLSVHSPVSIGTYDTQGNFTGKVCDDEGGNCVIKEDIPGSTYFEFGEGKYTNLGRAKLQKVVLQGTDIGTFTFDSQIVTPGGQTTTSSFITIPVTTQTQAEITLNTDGTPQLRLDVTGDGAIDFTLYPTTTFDPITYLQIMRVTVDSLGLPPSKVKAFDTRIDSIISSIQQGKVEKTKLNVDKFRTILENRLVKTDPLKPKPKKLSKADAQLLLDMLNQLLDNIG